jgi:hypothetical protein
MASNVNGNGSPTSRFRIVEASPTSTKLALSSGEGDRPYSLALKRKRTNPTLLAAADPQLQLPVQSSSCDLLAIHRRALQSLFESSSSSCSYISSSRSKTVEPQPHAHAGTKTQQDRLLELQRQRIAAKVQLEEYRHATAIGSSSSSGTVGDELRRRYRNYIKASADRPYLHALDIGHQTQTCETDVETNKHDHDHDPLVQQALEERDLAVRMQALRQRRKIAAAYRLAGISITPCADENVLALRFDILTVQGKYTACYHAFFDLVVASTSTIVTDLDRNKKEKTIKKKTDNDDSSGSQDLYLRLVQHTLPPSIPLATIVEETLGGIAVVGPLENEDQWKTDELVKKLRKCSNQLHQACYCYTARKESYAFLQTLTAQSRNESGEHNRSSHVIVVEALEPTDTFSKISFRLQLLSGMPSLRVELTYKDAMRSQPTGVMVRTSSASGSSSFMDVSRNQATSVEVISDEEEAEGTDDLVDTATMAFRRLPMRQAVKEVTAAMLEW